MDDPAVNKYQNITRAGSQDEVVLLGCGKLGGMTDVPT